MPSKRLSNKSFERDASRLRVLMNNDFGSDSTGSGISNYASPLSGIDYTTSVDLLYTGAGVFMDGTCLVDVRGNWRVPDTFAGGTISIKAAVSIATSGTMTCYLDGYIERCNNNITNAWTPSDWTNETVTKSGSTRLLNCIKEKTTSLLQAGDFIRLIFRRDGTAGSDTNTDAYFVGFIITF